MPPSHQSSLALHLTPKQTAHPACNVRSTVGLPSSHFWVRYTRLARASAWERLGSFRTWRSAFEAAVMAWM